MGTVPPSSAGIQNPPPTLAAPNFIHADNTASPIRMTPLPAMCRFAVPILAVAMMIAASQASAREISVQEAVDRVQQDTHAKVLNVRTLQIGKRKIYRIKILTPGGQVRVIEIKADQK